MSVAVFARRLISTTVVALVAVSLFGGAAGRAATPVANLLPNGGAEVDASGWWMSSGGRATLSRSTARAASGVASLRVDMDGTAPGQGVLTLSSSGAAAPNVTYTAQARVWIPSGASYALEVNARSGTGALLQTSTSPAFTGGGTWKLVTRSFTPTDTRTARIGLKLRQAGAVGRAESIWIDNAQIETGSVASPYVESPQALRSYAGRVGISSHFYWLSEVGARAQMARLKAGGVTWVREDFRWDRLEPQRGTFDWVRTDHVMAAAAASGVNVLGLITHAPPWASGSTDPVYPPKNPDEFAAFAAAVVSRYGTGGSFWPTRPELTPRPLTAVEIWNEPFGRWAWKPNPDPVAYAALAHKAAVAIHAVQSDVTVLVCGDVIQQRADGAVEVPWLAKVLAADPQLSKLANGYAVHPYSDNRGPYDSVTKQIYRFDRVTLTRDVARAYGASLPIWITEVGWSTGVGGLSEATQAEYTRGATVRALDEWGSFVARIFVFSWDVSDSAGTLNAGYGLRRPDDSARPAWDALKALLAR
ncbi:MAG: polysaccharide biosynthesis protein PslG [Gaiellaceae bacterium]|nr:polysaccharide biosynthesis protein PslG [Gaiellaceae bacterium]